MYNDKLRYSIKKWKHDQWLQRNKSGGILTGISSAKIKIIQLYLNKYLKWKRNFI